MGSACLTAAAKDRGLDMLAPIELSWGRDALEMWVTQLFAEGGLCWAWIAPPRRTFVRTFGSDGRRLRRSHQQPEGDLEQPEVALERKRPLATGPGTSASSHRAGVLFRARAPEAEQSMELARDSEVVVNRGCQVTASGLVCI